MICMSRLCNCLDSCGRSKRPVRCLIWEEQLRMTSEQRPNSTGFDVCYLCLANCVAKWFMAHCLVRSLTSDLLLIFMSQVTMRASKMSLRSLQVLTLGEFLFWCNFCCWWTLRSSIQTLFLMTRLGRKVSELLSEHPENFSVFWTSRWGDFLGFGHDVCCLDLGSFPKKTPRRLFVNGSQAEHRRTLWLAHAGRNEHGQRQSRDGECGNQCCFMYFHVFSSGCFQHIFRWELPSRLPWHFHDMILSFFGYRWRMIMFVFGIPTMVND